DNSCLLHIGGTLTRQGSAVRPVHIAEILARPGSRTAVSCGASASRMPTPPTAKGTYTSSTASSCKALCAVLRQAPQPAGSTAR
ncbi:hypothetical protein ABZS78_40685, partial [Streptomyces decoyicus]